MIRFYLIALLWFRLFLRLLNKIFIYFFQTENTSKWVTSLPISITFVSNSSKTRCERRLKITVQSSALLFGSFWPREKITFASKFPTEAEERHLKNAADGLITCIQQLLLHQRFWMLTFLHIKTLNAWSPKKWRKKAWILLLETDEKIFRPMMLKSLRLPDTDMASPSPDFTRDIWAEIWCCKASRDSVLTRTSILKVVLLMPLKESFLKIFGRYEI